MPPLINSEIEFVHYHQNNYFNSNTGKKKNKKKRNFKVPRRNKISVYCPLRMRQLTSIAKKRKKRKKEIRVGSD